MFANHNGCFRALNANANNCECKHKQEATQGPQVSNKTPLDNLYDLLMLFPATQTPFLVPHHRRYTQIGKPQPPTQQFPPPDPPPQLIQLPHQHPNPLATTN